MEKATPDDIPIIDLTETTDEDSDSEEQHENCNELICKQHGFGLPVVIKPEPGLKNKKVEKQIAKKHLQLNKVLSEIAKLQDKCDDSDSDSIQSVALEDCDLASDTPYSLQLIKDEIFEDDHVDSEHLSLQDISRNNEIFTPNVFTNSGPIFQKLSTKDKIWKQGVTEPENLVVTPDINLHLGKSKFTTVKKAVKRKLDLQSSSGLDSGLGSQIVSQPSHDKGQDISITKVASPKGSVAFSGHIVPKKKDAVCTVKFF